MTNVLLLSAGRRVELTRYLISELQNRNQTAKLFTADLNPFSSAACQAASHYFVLPPASSPNYIDSLIEQCISHDIRLVIPTIDTELVPLSSSLSKLSKNGITVLVSSPELVLSCRDKRSTSAIFHSIGVKTPKHYNPSSLQYPCFVKPYDGSCSNGTAILHAKEDLTQSLLSNPKNIFMEFIDAPFVEYSVDAYYDSTGKLACMVPRRRISVRAGEVNKALTVKGHLYSLLLPHLRKLQGARGCLTFQFFYNSNTQELYGIEINPRFGGGFPLSYLSGANYIGWLLDEYLYHKEIPFYDRWSENMLMLRYDAQLVIPNSNDKAV